MLDVACSASAIIVLLFKLLFAEANRTKPNTFDQVVDHNATLLTAFLLRGLSCRTIATRTVFKAMVRNFRFNVACSPSAIVVLLFELLVDEANRTKPLTFDQVVDRIATLFTAVLLRGLSCSIIATRNVFEAIVRNFRPGRLHA
jgi:hypothetical protein